MILITKNKRIYLIVITDISMNKKQFKSFKDLSSDFFSIEYLIR